MTIWSLILYLENQFQTKQQIWCLISSPFSICKNVLNFFRQSKIINFHTFINFKIVIDLQIFDERTSELGLYGRPEGAIY